MPESSFADPARMIMRAREDSLRVFPIETSSRSNVPPSMRIVSKTLARISESMMCPLRTTVACVALMAGSCHDSTTRVSVPWPNGGELTEFGGFHHLPKHAGGIGPWRERKRQGERRALEAPVEICQRNTQGTAFAPETADFGRFDQALRCRALF